MSVLDVVALASASRFVCSGCSGTWPITCKGEDACYATGLAQERIPIWNYRGIPSRHPRIWTPPAPTPRFFRWNNAIVDLKLQKETVGWKDIPVGEFSDEVQEFRLVIRDQCGTPKEYFLDTYDVKWKKTDDISYNVEHSKRKK